MNWESVRKNWAILFLIITWIGGGIAYYVHDQVDNELIKSRIFKDPEEKVKVINHVDNAPSPAQLQRKYIMDSINTMTAIRFRKSQDSMTKVRDSILMLNADQMYQIKEQLKKLSIPIEE